jgi:hypothetical protein
MTRFNKYLAVAATAVGAVASSGAFAAGNVLFQNLPTGQTTCSSFSSTSVDGSSGDLTVTCKSTTPPVAGALGTMALASTKFTGAKSTSTTPANISVSVVRSGGVTGQLNGTLSVTGTGCQLAFNSIQFADQDGAAKAVNLSSTNSGTSICNLTLVSAMTGGLGSPASATVDVTDASTPPPTIAGCPTTPANVVMLSQQTLGYAGRFVDKARTDGLPPTIYSYALPPNHFPGAFFTTRDPDTPPSLNVEITVSKCPGDYNFTNDPSEIYTYSWAPTTPFYPCISHGNAEGAAVRWDTTLALNNCKVDSGQWYVNVRVVDSQGNYSCPIASATGPGCPLRFWWN